MSIKIMSMVWETANSLLTPTEKSILLRLADFAAADGSSIYPSWKRVVHDTGHGRRTVARAFKSLCDKGFLIKLQEAVKEEHLSCVYKIDVHKLTNSKTSNVPGANLSLENENEDICGVTAYPSAMVAPPSTPPSATQAPPPSVTVAPHPSLNNRHSIFYENEKNLKFEEEEENEMENDIPEDYKKVALEKGLRLEKINSIYSRFVTYYRDKDLKSPSRAWLNWLKKAIEFNSDILEGETKKTENSAPFDDPHKNCPFTTQFREELRNKIGNDAYKSWFEEVLIQVSDLHVHVQAPTLFFYDTFISRFSPQLTGNWQGRKIIVYQSFAP